MSLEDHFSAVGQELGAGNVTAEFFPFCELKHTWVGARDHLHFKISDYLESAPDEVLESLAWYLVSRAVGRSCGSEKSRAYLEHSRSSALWEAKRDLYFRRSGHLDLEPRGDYRDLRVAYSYVNSYYFAGRLPELTLAWADESARRRLGYYFEPLRLLAVNKALDSEQVPRYVLEFVIFHEMLHHVDGNSGRAKRRIHHTKKFREEEMRFTHYDDAERWLRRIVAHSPRKKQD